VKITLSGASGFIGPRLVNHLLADGHTLHVLGRRRPATLPKSVSFTAWDALTDTRVPPDALRAADAIIHLAGEPVAQRWTDNAKQKIRASRVRGTTQIVEGVRAMDRPPSALISASAIGYYADRGEEVLTESSTPGSGFLAELCVEWERLARDVEPLGVRVAPVRLGIVLGPDGGALKQMLTPFRLGVGGRIGSGRQWMSWIHVDDVVGLIAFATKSTKINGPLNATAPAPVRNSDFTKSLARVLHRPAIFPVPEFVLQIVCGEMASVVTGSQRVLPAAAERAGYDFRFTNLDKALADLL
jgi:uncharacterized protein (TIGR01777 family)